MVIGECPSESRQLPVGFSVDETRLALVLRKDLEERLSAARLKPEWRELLADLDRLQEVEAEQDGKRFILRTPVTGVAGKVFQAVGIPLPPNIREADPLPSAA
jgi:hypothetical protein